MQDDILVHCEMIEEYATRRIEMGIGMYYV